VFSTKEVIGGDDSFCGVPVSSRRGGPLEGKDQERKNDGLVQKSVSGLGPVDKREKRHTTWKNSERSGNHLEVNYLS